MGVEFDSSRLDALAGDAPELVRELVSLFTTDVAERLSRLREAVERGDDHSTKRAAHGIKGAAINMGAEGLATLAEALEYAESDAEPQGSTDRMQAEFEAVSAMLVERYCK
jgi:HPt (histidine-containing phosphotransfer) domain-containing protein